MMATIRCRRYPDMAFLAAAITLPLFVGCGRNPNGRGPGSDRSAKSPPASGSPSRMASGGGSTAPTAPAISPAEALAITWPEEAKSSPVAGGYGLIICEPVIGDADEPTAAFGAGCARWLQFVVGGQGELNKTPLWDAVSRAEHEMNRTELRLTMREAPELAQNTGVTHVVVSHISGSPANCALTCYLAQLDNQRIVGPSLTLRGTQQQVLAQLPSLAKQLASRLDMRNPHVPARISALPAEMQMLGRRPWQPTRDLPARDKDALVALAPKVSVAAIMALASNNLYEQDRFKMLDKSLVAQAPDNAMTYGCMGYLETSGMETYKTPFEKLYRQYSGNYLLAAANLQRAYRFDHAQERASAQALVRMAPKNPDAWLSLGYAVSNEADRIRQGRYSSQISGGEYSSLDRLYAEWMQDVRKATELDPRHAKAWARLAMAATFAGDFALADSALWKALELDKENEAAIEWGMQMYQPKWRGDPGKLLKVAQMAVEAYHYDDRSPAVAEMLKQGGQELEAKRLLKRIVTREQENARKNPDDYRAQYSQAWGLKELGRFQEASDDFKAVLRNFPRETAQQADPYYGLAMCLSEMGRHPEAIAAFQTFLRKNPNHVRAHLELGYSFRKNGQPQKAIPELKEVIRLSPRYGDAYAVLGDAYLDSKRGAEAFAMYQSAHELLPENEIVVRCMCMALGMSGRYSDAVKYGEMAIQQDPGDMEAHGALAYAYGMNNQNQQSADECRVLLKANPNDAVAHENLGDALNKLGHRKEARDEWETTLRLDSNGKIGNGDLVKEARENLQKYP